MLAAIERATRQKITRLELPTTETVNNKRIADFKQKITDTLAGGEMTFMQNLVEQYRDEHDIPALEIAAALAKMSIGDKSLLLAPDKERPVRHSSDDRPQRHSKDDRQQRDRKPRNRALPELDSDKERYRIEVGHEHDVKPGNIVGAIANEAGLAGEHIGHISIEQSYSLVDLPSGMPRDILMDLKKVRVCGRPMKIALHGASEDESGKPRADKPRSDKSGYKSGKPRANKPGGKPHDRKSKPKGKPKPKPTSKARSKLKLKPKAKPKS